MLHYIKNFPIVLKIVIYTLEKNEKSKYLWKKKKNFLQSWGYWYSRAINRTLFVDLKK